MQTATNQTEAQGRLARRPNRRKGAQNWHTLEAPSVKRSVVGNRNQRLTESRGGLWYGPDNSESARSQRITGMLVLPFLSIVVGFLLTAAILNSATSRNLEAFAILAVVVVAAIVGFFHVLKAARALDEIEYATHGSDRVNRKRSA